MWCSIFLIACVSLVTAQAAPAVSDPYAEDMKNRNQIALECINEVNIDIKIVRKAIYAMPYELPTDEKYKKFLTCSYKKQKFQSENGEMLYDNINDFLSRSYSRDDLKILDQCKNITAPNDAEMAYTSLKCIMKGLHGIKKTEDNTD
nr:odorant binding protein 53 [Monochamus saltuarius]